MDRNCLLRGVCMVSVGAFGIACSGPQQAPATGPVVRADMAMAPTPVGPTPPPPDLALPPPGPTTMLPFVVDTAFVSSGYMGDGAMPGTVTMTPAKMGDSGDCNGMRSSGSAAGSCHVVGYTPPASGGMGWAGVFWQFPANNWGMKPGYSIPPGAKKVTFQAKGAKGGEKVTFLAGGIIGAGNPYTDSLKAQVVVTLTNAWAPYSIDLTGQTYTQVLGGFGWTMAATDAGASGSFFVDDIEWQ